MYEGALAVPVDVHLRRVILVELDGYVLELWDVMPEVPGDHLGQARTDLRVGGHAQPQAVAVHQAQSESIDEWFAHGVPLRVVGRHILAAATLVPPSRPGS